jgi:hypothetical protein
LTICFVSLAPSVDCSTPRYAALRALSVATIALYGVGFPALCSAALQARARLPWLHAALAAVFDQSPLALLDRSVPPGWSALLFYARKFVFAAVLGLLGAGTDTATYLFLLLLFMLMFHVSADARARARATTRALQTCRFAWPCARMRMRPACYRHRPNHARNRSPCCAMGRPAADCLPSRARSSFC